MTVANPRWQVASLEEVARPDAPIGYGIVQVGPYDRTGVPVLAIRDLLKPSPKTAHRSSPKIEAAYRRSRVQGGDVLISVKGTTGKVGIVPPDFVGNISRDVARVRLRGEHDPQFWVHLLRSDDAQKLLQLAAVGTTRQELSIGTLKGLRFSFPDASEQSRIAAIMSDVDRLIELNDLTLTKRRNLKAAAAAELMSEGRRTGAWASLPLGDLVTIDKGKQLGRAEMDPTGSVPVWNGGVEPSGFTNVPNTSDRVVTVSEGGNSCGWVGRPAGPFWLGGHCYALRPRSASFPLSFLYQALKFYESRIMALRVGSGLPNIQKGRLRGFAVDVPTENSDAARIAQTLDDFDASIRAVDAERKKLIAVKQAMLQRLMTDGVSS